MNEGSREHSGPSLTPADEDAMRAAFEAFVLSELGDVAVSDRGRYISPKIQNYWRTWQGAIRSVQ